MQPRQPQRPRIRAVRRELPPARRRRRAGRWAARLGTLLLLTSLVGGGAYLWREGWAHPAPAVAAARAGTIVRSLEVDGLIVRREEVVTAPAAGRVGRLIAEGERARVGTPVVEILPGGASEPEAPAGGGAAGQPPAAFAETAAAEREYDRLNVEIHRLAVALSQARLAGETGRVMELEAEIDQVARRQGELASLLRAADAAAASARSPDPGRAPSPRRAAAAVDGGTPIAAPASGVVLYQTDGLESALRPDEAETWTPSWLRALPDPDLKPTTEGAVAAGDPLFKVVDDFEVELVILLPAGRLSPSQRTEMAESGVTLRLAGSERPVTARVRRMAEEGGELLLHLSVPTPGSEMLRVRRVRAELLLTSFTGIIVPRSAIDVLDGRTGVWVRTAGDFRFTPVRVLGGNQEEVAVEGDLPPDTLVLREVPPPNR